MPIAPRRPRRWLPSPLAWVKALCLLPLAIPGVRVVMSGLSWFTWLNFSGSWLVASVMFITMHVAIPISILAGLYHLIRSLWPSETPRSARSSWWFAISTFAIIVMSFLGTVGIAALVELSICRMPLFTTLLGICSNYFINTELSDLAANIDTYNFRYYNWLVWIVITACLYQLEHYLRVNRPSQTTTSSEDFPAESEEINRSKIDNVLGQDFVDETA